MVLEKLENLDKNRKDAIINAALMEFATKGYDEASTIVIARNAGISKGLMFYYVNSKKDFFLFLCDYCSKIVKREYFDLINFNEKDLLERLRQSYILQLELLHKYPWILEFTRITADEKSDEIRKELDEILKGTQPICYETMFGTIDASRFREGMDIERCKRLIFWVNVGFTNQILKNIRNSEISELDYERIVEELDGYLNELRKSFYK
ncbi:MAG TPA: TetR/AcrR family transcriptional regulator [Patescibacteria group bacterium]|nr:TetR/AcrR family transcriptional regulator [Patescibacteria group bacterium]